MTRLRGRVAGRSFIGCERLESDQRCGGAFSLRDGDRAVDRNDR
jgi:hypothetical protein